MESVMNTRDFIYWIEGVFLGANRQGHDYEREGLFLDEATLLEITAAIEEVKESFSDSRYEPARKSEEPNPYKPNPFYFPPVVAPTPQPSYIPTYSPSDPVWTGVRPSYTLTCCSKESVH